MSKSYRIRTKVGVDTSLKVLIEQEFEHLEILSLKILQSDIYTRQCADYGVVVGRVSVNNGFGLPNAKVSIFLPLDSIDQNNPIISELYPYKTLLDNNDGGYRYNLLPYVKSYSAHVPTGTFFTRNDVLTNPTLIEVYDKYYKYNATTNESGDFMIFGVPVGSHTIVMDVDLSDIGEFSLSPQDLIRMGLATEAQVAGTNFKSSTNLRELPQIINLTKSIEVEPLWGQPEICNLGITRTDFDLSSEAKIDIRPTSVFMGSIISGPNSSAVSSGCRPPNRSGQLCDLTVGPGEILAIRQTIQQDSNGRPILENFTLEGGGKVIDQNGTWLIDVPMNLDYFVTNEFGEQVLSNDPEVGIPTKGKYRFKVKWTQSPSLSETTRRAYFLVPNIKEHKTPNIDESYAFSVDWNDYAFSGNSNFNRIIQEAIDCEDRFYMMQYNKVYTVSQFISGIRKGGGSERYVGIKNILDETCSGLNNRFPTNDGNFKFDILYIIFYFFSILLTPIFFALLLLLHILYFVVWILRVLLVPGLIIYFGVLAVNSFIGAFSYGFGATFSAGIFAMGFVYLLAVVLLILVEIQLLKIKLSGIKVPILTYPECDLCSCSPESEVNEDIGADVGADQENDNTNKVVPCQSISSDTDITSITLQEGILPLFNIGTFEIPIRSPNEPDGYAPERAQVYQQNFTGLIYDNQYASNNIGAPYMKYVLTGEEGEVCEDRWIYSLAIPLADRINLFNVKAKYFNSGTTNPGGGVNIISVNFEPTQSVKTHRDNTIVILCNKETLQSLTPGQLIAFQDPTNSGDINLSGGILNVYGNNAITGTTTTGNTINIPIRYALPDGSGNSPVINYSVQITATTTNNFHKFPTDVEYFQVITAMTYNQFSGQCQTQFPNSLNQRYVNNTIKMGESGYCCDNPNPAYNNNFNPLDFIENVNEICVLIMNRGVDPYTPKVPIKYGLGRLFGRTNLDDISVTGLYHMNIPIQGKFLNISHLSSNYPSTTVNGVTAGSNVGVDSYTNTNQQLYFNSFSYTPQITEIVGEFTGTSLGIPYTYTAVTSSKYSAFTSNLISYYSSMDNNSPNNFVANCGGTNIINVMPLNTQNVALVDPTNGIKVNPDNKFSWYIYTLLRPSPCFHDGQFESSFTNIISPLYKNNPTTIENKGYFPNEIIEGGPLMYTNMKLGFVSNPGRNVNSGKLYPFPTTCNGNSSAFNYIYNTNGVKCGGEYYFYITSNYYSPIYDTTGNTLNFSLGSNNNQIVMRGDRLPTSTNVEEYCCNAMVLQKNNNFQIFLIPEEGVLNITSSPGTTEGAGSGDLEYLYDDLVGSEGIATVFETFTCEGSVPLPCYKCEKTGPNGTITVSTGSCDECLGKSIFSNGCYKFVTTIFLSLGCDISNMFEWIARNLIILGACRNVFSHRFVNNWVNGVLYAFPIKTDVRGFTSPTSSTPNQPIMSYCNDAVILHPQTRNFYYRATPYDISTNEFKPRDNDKVSGSNNNICFPTTIMDLGPRADYLQELVMSDDYDGYVANKLDSSSFGTVDDILNLFIVSRFVGNNILDLIIKSNILAYFSNSRRNNGVGGGKFMIDADYAQLISINSELGVAPFLSSNYPDAPNRVTAGSFVIGDQYKIIKLGVPTPTDFTQIGASNNNLNTIFTATGPGTGDGQALVIPALQNPIFFDCDNVLGIFFSSDTQTRDYITPKRTIISPSATTQSVCAFNNFSVYSQVVPLSQWRIATDPTSYSGDDSIFGRQFNNWDFTVSANTVFSHRYQSLDRLNRNSRYFRSENISQTQYQKGYIYAVNANGYISADPQYWNENDDDDQLVTVGAPFHFYFGLRRGASAFDRFRTKWINTSNVTN